MCESRLCEHGSSDLTYSAVWCGAVMSRRVQRGLEASGRDADRGGPTDDRTVAEELRVCVGPGVYLALRATKIYIIVIILLGGASAVRNHRGAFQYSRKTCGNLSHGYEL